MFVVSDKRFYWLKVRRLLMSFSYANAHLSHSALNLSDKVLTLCEEHNCLFCRKIDKYLYSINARTSSEYLKIGLIRIFYFKNI